MKTEQRFEFHETIAAVEERFRPMYDSERIADAKIESQVEKTMVSTGWWVVLARFGIAIRFGDRKPNFEAGDTLVLVPHVLKRKPGAPAPASPDAPKPIGSPQHEKV